MRRFPRRRGLVTGFALIGLVTAVLVGGTSGPAHATSTGPPVFNNLPPGTGGACPKAQQPCQVVVADSTDYATFKTGITAHKNGSQVLVPVRCTPLVPGDPLPPLGPNAAPVQLRVRLTPPPYGLYQYSCTATDSTTNASATATVSLTAVDQPTVVHTPGPQTGNADATDTATVYYPTPVTASEYPTGESDPIVPGCVPSLPNGATSDNAFVSSGTFPVGVTNLYCTASDNFDGQPGPVPPNAYLRVTVADQPVTLTVPPTQLAQATSSSGATVSYGPVVGAEGSEAETIGSTCSADKPAASSADGFISGGNFPVGATTLTCYATDTVDGFSSPPPPPQSFTVIVTKTPCAALAGCNLHGLDLSNAILAGGDLSSGTDLSYANLNKADLSGANLSFANLSGVNLNQADLTGANLTGANLTGANLNNAKLDGVIWSNTTCPDGTNSSASTPETCVAVPATMTIGNTPPWTPSAGISGNFGVSGAPTLPTPTYGQTVTVPLTDTRLDSFTFYLDLPPSLTFRGEVYAWTPGTTDPANPYALGSATGPALYESGPMQTASFGNCTNMHAFTFNTGGIMLTANTQYVLFITTSRDPANAGISATGCLGVTANPTYSGGDGVYQDDGGYPNNWTTLGWTHPALFTTCPPCFNQDDLGFTATFSLHKNTPGGP
jgi:hypothetical protein